MNRTCTAFENLWNMRDRSIFWGDRGLHRFFTTELHHGATIGKSKPKHLQQAYSLLARDYIRSPINL